MPKLHRLFYLRLPATLALTALSVLVTVPALAQCKSDPSYAPGEILRLLNMYWSGKFGVPPYVDLVGLSQWSNPKNPVQYQHFEPYGASSIRYDVNALNQMAARLGPFAPVVPFAHEFGHYVQVLGGRGLFLQHGTPARELDADRLAGAFIRSLVDGNNISAGCLAVAKALVRGFGSPTHGTGQQRAACVQYGYDRGPSPFTRGQKRGDAPVDCAPLASPSGYEVGQITMPTGIHRNLDGTLVATAQAVTIIIYDITPDGEHIGPQRINPPGYYVSAEGDVHRGSDGDFFYLEALYDAAGRRHEINRTISLRGCEDNAGVSC